jgi:hypothetical protein
VDADRRDLPRRPLEPHARQPVDARRADAERGDRANERLLEIAAVALHVLPVPGEVENRVADELPRPVVGRLPAAVRLDDRDVGAVGDVQLARLRATAERDRRRMLEE